MGCKKVTIKIGKALAQHLKPTLISFITDMTGLVQNTDWTNDNKREAVVLLAKARAKQLGQEAKESAIRAMVELAVVGARNLGEEVNELGKMEMAEVEGIEEVD